MNAARAIETLVRLIAYREGVEIASLEIERRNDNDGTQNDDGDRFAL